MDPVKRKVILTEIEHWRQSKLLPEHYCDFLRNLYIIDDSKVASGSGSVLTNGAAGSAKRMKMSYKSVIYLIGIFSLILVLFLYFTTFSPVMQTALSALLVGLLIAIGVTKRNTHPIGAFSSLGAGCMLALFLGLFILRVNDWGGPGMTVALVAACGMLWMLAGIVCRIGLLQLCGWFAWLLGLYWLIQEIHSNPSWVILQAYTLPAALLLYYIGKSMYNGIRSNGSILLTASGLFLLTPEVFGLIFTDISGFILQPALAMKMALAGIAIWAQWKRTKNSTELYTEHE